MIKLERIDWEQISDILEEKYAALIITHFFGVPYDFRPVFDVARKLGILIIEDCAHTLGGKIGNRTAGTLGDAAIFSFNHDKPISLGGGGILLVNNPELINKIKITGQGDSPEIERKELTAFMEFLRVRRDAINKQTLCYKVAGKLLRWFGMKRKNDFKFPNGIGSLRSTIGLYQLEKISQIINIRNKNANFLNKESNCQFWHVDPNVRPAWLKQKVIITEGTNLSKLTFRLQKCGLRVGQFNWPKTIDSYLGYPEKINSKFISVHGLDIPIHQNMNKTELEFILRNIS